MADSCWFVSGVLLRREERTPRSGGVRRDRGGSDVSRSSATGIVQYSARPNHHEPYIRLAQTILSLSLSLS